MKVSTRKIVTLFIFVILILIETISLGMYRESMNKKERMRSIVSVEAELTDEEEETLRLINEYRKENGLKELKAVSKLQEVAKLKANDLVQNEYFSHTSEVLGTPFEMLEDNGIDYIKAGENLAGNKNPERAVNAWINSPSHRDNILKAEYEYTGICVIDSPMYGKVFVQLFITT